MTAPVLARQNEKGNHHADWVVFCKNGTDATTMAMTAARAHTQKRKILVAKKAYHGAAPWCTPILNGTVPEERAHILQYEYNNPTSLEEAFRAAGDDVAGVFASAFRHDVFEDQELPSVEYAKLLARFATVPEPC